MALVSVSQNICLATSLTLFQVQTASERYVVGHVSWDVRLFPGTHYHDVASQASAYYLAEIQQLVGFLSIVILLHDLRRRALTWKSRTITVSDNDHRHYFGCVYHCGIVISSISSPP